MATATLPPQTMAELIAALPDDILYEEIDDTFVEKPPLSAYEYELGSLLAHNLGTFLDEARLGRAVSEMLFNLRPAVTCSRRPDVAFLSAARWPLDRRAPRTGSWAVIPDLAIEIVSPTNSADDVLAKIDEYFLAGVIRVWVIYPESAKVYLYDSPKSTRILTRDDTLTDDAILPGFRLDLNEFFGPPE